MFFHWRPSAHAKRHCAKLDRYYAKCQKVAGGHHSTPPHEKRYNWLVKQDYQWIGM